MEDNKKKKTIIFSVIAVVTMLVAVVGITYAYFSADTTGNTGNVDVNAETAKQRDVFSTSGEAELSLNITSDVMQQNDSDNGYSAFQSDTGSFTVSLTAGSSTATCTYDIVMSSEGDTYEKSEDAGNLLEYTIKGSDGTQSFAETNIDTALATNNGVLGRFTISDSYDEGNQITTTQTWTVESRFYNLNKNQNNQLNKEFEFHVKVDNVNCGSTEENVPAVQFVPNFNRFLALNTSNITLNTSASYTPGVTVARKISYPLTPFIYADVSMFEESKLQKLQLFVGTVSSGNQYKFTLSKIDSSSVAVGKKTVIKESYTINVSGDDLVSNSWNTIDISSYNISIGEGETLGFGLPTDTLEVYYLTGLKSNDGIYYGSTNATDDTLSLRNNYNMMIGVRGVSTHTITKQEKQLSQILSGKNISLLGASIVTYQGYSNNTSYNSTIGNNAVFYSSSNLPSVNDTFWMQAINEYNMNLVVNNSWSGSKVLDDRTNAAGYNTRPMQLHDDNGENQGTYPDIIVVYMGLNDNKASTPTGTLTNELYTTIENKVDGSDSSFPTSFVAGYIEMIYKIKKTYSDADIFAWGIPDRGVDKTLLDQYNTSISQICEHYGCYYLDLPNHPLMSGANYNSYTVGDNVHPNSTGMDIMTDILVDGFKDYYLN